MPPLELCCESLGRDTRRDLEIVRRGDANWARAAESFFEWAGDAGLAEALTYQDSYLYQAAYCEEDEPPDLEIHTRINVFLEQWLDNLAEQGHVLPRGR